MDADFDRELAKLMAESMEARRTERRAVFDVPLPIVRRNAPTPSMPFAPFGEEELPPKPAAPSGSVQFSLLVKRGNKQQTRDIALPSDSSFAVAMRHQQQAEREEQQRIKSLVLNLDHMSATRDNKKDGAENEGPATGDYTHGKRPDRISYFPQTLLSVGRLEVKDDWAFGNPNRIRGEDVAIQVKPHSNWGQLEASMWKKSDLLRQAGDFSSLRIGTKRSSILQAPAVSLSIHKQSNECKERQIPSLYSLEFPPLQSMDNKREKHDAKIEKHDI
jgi:Up-frameshift suppressor 2